MNNADGTDCESTDCIRSKTARQIANSLQTVNASRVRRKLSRSEGNLTVSTSSQPNATVTDSTNLCTNERPMRMGVRVMSVGSRPTRNQLSSHQTSEPIRSFQTPRSPIGSQHLHSCDQLRPSLQDLSRPLNREDIFFSGSIARLSEYESNQDFHNYVASVTNIHPNSPICSKLCHCCSEPVQSACSSMLDPRLLFCPSFMVLCVANVFGFMGLYIPNVYRPDRAVHDGIDGTKAAFLVAIYGK